MYLYVQTTEMCTYTCTCAFTCTYYVCTCTMVYYICTCTYRDVHTCTMVCTCTEMSNESIIACIYKQIK